MLRRRGLCLLAVALPALGSAACTGTDGSAAQVGSPVTVQPSDDVPAVLATVGDEQITMAAIREKVGDQLDALQTNYERTRRELIQRTLDGILQDKVLSAEAQKQGKTVDDLVLAEAGGSFEPTDVEITTWFQENQDRLGGRPLDQLKPQIADYLRKQSQAEAAGRLQDRLNAERGVKINLQPYRLKFDNENSPVLGNDDAPVTLVEFSDFQCPFCGRFFSTLKRVEQQFGDTVRIVYRQYPIPSLHPNAQKAAEASLCANEQGKFWQMHDLMFQDQSNLLIKDLKDKASSLGLDRQRFDACLESGRYVEQIQKDQAEGSRVGVTGTPAIFVNGVPLPGGAVPYDVIEKAIRDELRRQSR